MKYIIAFLLSIIITPIAIKLNILDKPNYRKIHTKPVPKAGGLGIFIPYILLILSYVYVNGWSKITLAILTVTIYLLIVGMIDDKIELSSKVKLILQSAAGIFTVLMGIYFEFTSIYAVNILVSFAFIVGIINAVNLIDGLDGLSTGVGVISLCGILYLSIFFNNTLLLFLSSILISSGLGFLIFNFRPAKIFMGDTGSLPLGYNLAVLTIICSNEIRGINGLLFSIIILGLPIFDTLLTMYRRFINKRPVFAPDRSHFYNLLMDLKGIEHRNVVLLLYCINFILVILSFVFIKLNEINRILEFIGIIILSVFLTHKYDLVKVDNSEKINKEVD